MYCMAAFGVVVIRRYGNTRFVGDNESAMEKARLHA